VGGIQALGFNPDGSLLAVAYGGQQAIVIGYDFPKGAIRWTYEPKAVQGTPSVATGIVFSADGRRLMFGTGEVGRDTDGSPTRSSAIAVLDSWTGIQERRIDRIHVDHPTALAISPDDKWLVSATSTGTVTQTANLKTKQRITRENNDPVRVWNINNGGLLKELPVQSRVWSLVVTKDGRYVIGSRSDHKNQLTLVMWDVEAAAIAQEIQTREVSIALALSSDGRELAGAAGKELVIYGLQ
jgi:WD40 repeat protein